MAGDSDLTSTTAFSGVAGAAQPWTPSQERMLDPSAVGETRLGYEMGRVTGGLKDTWNNTIVPGAQSLGRGISDMAQNPGGNRILQYAGATMGLVLAFGVVNKMLSATVYQGLPGFAKFGLNTAMAVGMAFMGASMVGMARNDPQWQNRRSPDSRLLASNEMPPGPGMNG